MTNDSNNAAGHKHCSICSQLKDYEYALQTHGRPDEDTFIPKIAEKLKNIIELKTGSDRYTLLRQCPECATSSSFYFIALVVCCSLHCFRASSRTT
jgi:hypothetical protein